MNAMHSTGTFGIRNVKKKNEWLVKDKCKNSNTTCIYACRRNGNEERERKNCKITI